MKLRLLFGRLFRGPLGPPVRPQDFRVIFDAERVTKEIKSDLRRNIAGISDISPGRRPAIYAAGILSLQKGRDLHLLARAVEESGLKKRRAGEIARFLTNAASSLMTRNQQIEIGVTEAIWLHSGGPCYVSRKPSQNDIARDEAHRAADRQSYKVGTGMKMSYGIHAWPGQEDGCRCVSRSVLKGFT